MDEVNGKDKRVFFFKFQVGKIRALTIEEIFRLEHNRYLLSQKHISRKHLFNCKIFIYVICIRRSEAEMFRELESHPNPL